MNQNISEALREKGIAEKMMISKDYISARDKLLKAQKLYSAIENIGSMLTVCDILSASSIKFPGCGIDYYWVLQLMPSSTCSDVKHRYEKLVSLLQPVRYKFPGTDLALKLIQDAFHVLTDQDKRSAFELKRGANWEGYGSFNAQALFCRGISNKEISTTAQSSSGFERDSSSQISCGSSGVTKMLSESNRSLGPNLLTCHSIDKQQNKVIFQEPSQFSDVMNTKGSNGADVTADCINSPTALHSTNWKGNLSRSSKSVALKRPDQDFYNFENDRKPELFEAGQIWSAHYQADFQNYRYARVDINSKTEVCVTWLKPVPISAGERRWCEAGLPVACGSFDLDQEMNDKVSWPMVSSHKCTWVHGVTDEQFEIYPKRGEIWALYKDWNLDEWAYSPKTLKGCKFELVEMLSNFSKYSGADGAFLVKVDGFQSIFQRQTIGGNTVIVHIPPSNLYIFSHNVPAYRFTGGEIDKVVNGMFDLDQLALPDDMIQDNDIQKEPMEGNASSSSFTPVRQPPSLKSYSENKILNPSWLPNDFAIGQVWAVYCRKHYMPQKYVRINNVISESQVGVTFLEPQPTLDDEINWKKENRSIVCGTFKVSETSVILEMSQFSHLVKCQRSTTKPFYKIYPLKGEIWAMYRNWNKNWKHSDYDNHQCEVVEILSDFSEGNGVTIAKLGEVKGCLTFFHRQQYDGFDLTHVVSKTEMLAFSHQIPAFRVPGIGNYGIPESSWHLEPNALPPKHRT